MNDNLQYFFNPRSIAVVGASYHEKKIGYRLVYNIVKGGYRGDVYPINPKAGEMLGIKVWESMEALDAAPDMALIVVPAAQVPEAVEACGRKGVQFAVIISSGFSETGKSGAEHEIVAAARGYGMRILGPNVFGIYSSAVSLNATFGVTDIPAGDVAIITQSGALGLAMIGKTAVENMGLSTICSVGNKSDLNEADLLAYLKTHDATKVILMYIEGVKDGERLVAMLEEVTRAKPVIVIKSGRSQRGAMAAASHTGSLAGADNVFGDIMKQCGVLRAETIDEAFQWCNYISQSPMPPGENTVIITNGGGVGVMAADACEKFGIPLFDDAARLEELFKPAIPPFGSFKNPIDLTGQASAIDYAQALNAARDSDGIHAAIALICGTPDVSPAILAAMVKDVCRQFADKGKLITFSLFGGLETEECLAILDRERVPAYGDVYEAVSSMGALFAYRRARAETEEGVPESAPDIAAAAIDALVERVRAGGRYFLLAHEAQEVMRAAGITVPRTAIAPTLEDAVARAGAIGFPVVMKVVSKDIIHKSDAGGVVLDIDDEKEVIDAYEAIMRNCRTRAPAAKIEGVEITEMVSEGIEIITGARKDSSFGPVVMVGLGGIYVEVMKDVAFRAYPAARRQLLAMIREIRSYPLLLGVRGEARKDIEGLVEVIAKLGAIVSRCAGITDIEINPLVVYEKERGVKAVDVRILLLKQPQ